MKFDTMPGARQVFRKEIKEMLRDRRVLIGAFVMPIFMIALFVFLMGFVMNTVTKKQVLEIAVTERSDDDFLENLRAVDELIIVTTSDFERGVQLLKEKQVKLVLDFPENMSEAVAQGQAEIHAGYMRDDPLSALALNAFDKAISQANQEAIRTVLRNQGMNEGLATAIRLNAEDRTEKKGMAGSELVNLLPYLIVLWAFFGGMSIVSDLVAGEKERGTMETLLISPVRRAEIAIGKIMSLSLICLMSASTTFVGIAVLGSLKLEMTKDLFPSGFHITFGGVFVILATLLTLVFVFATSMTAISAYARNIRESQTYLSLMSFVVLLPAVFSQLIGFTGKETANWVSWTPVLNSAMSIRNALKSEVTMSYVVGAVSVNLVIGLICLWFAIRLFRREDILQRV